MTPGQEMRKECEARLRALVSDHEDVLAIGLADEFPEPLGDLGGQGKWRLLVATSERLLSADWSKPERSHEEIGFADVSAWFDGMQYHRYIMTLQHPPMTGEERLPAHRFGPFRSRDRSSTIVRTTTTLRFSQRDTDVAKALRAVLRERDLPHGELPLVELSREERTRGSHVELRPE